MAADPIVTTTQLAAYQGGDPQSLIDQATALVRAWCGWHVTPSKTETLELEVDGSTFLPLPSLHVTGVTSVVMDSVTLVQDTDYQWSQAGVLTHLAPNGTAWSNQK